MISWKPEMSVGVDEIDLQHQEIFRRAAQADAALAEGRAGAELEALLAFLVDYCESHFGHEQRLMSRQAYPAMQEHLAEHAFFVREVKALQRKVAGGSRGEDLAMSLNELLLSWLVTHIGTFDLALATWLRARPPG